MGGQRAGARMELRGLVGIESGRSNSTGATDGKASAQKASREQHQQSAAMGKGNKLTKGPCTLRVVARLGLCMAEGVLPIEVTS
jgi:hypothetical protein